jgi:hypothetical protein
MSMRMVKFRTNVFRRMENGGQDDVVERDRSTQTYISCVFLKDEDLQTEVIYCKDNSN